MGNTSGYNASLPRVFVFLLPQVTKPEHLPPDFHYRVNLLSRSVIQNNQVLNRTLE
jgi:hypothetical protein